MFIKLRTELQIIYYKAIKTSAAKLMHFTASSLKLRIKRKLGFANVEWLKQLQASRTHSLCSVEKDWMWGELHWVPVALPPPKPWEIKEQSKCVYICWNMRKTNHNAAVFR